MSLGESVEWVLDAIIAEIQAEVDAKHVPFDTVKEVVRGDRARPMPGLPSIWVVPQTAQFAQEDYGEETWRMPVSLAALVKSEHPNEGGQQSRLLAAESLRIALGAKDRAGSLGVNIIDITSQSFDPTVRQSERNRTLFWTDATILVSFSV